MNSPHKPGVEQAQQDACTGVATAMTAVSIFIVALRTYSRQFVVGNFGKDDAMMLVALLFTIGYLIAIWVLRANGMGFSGASLTLDQMTNSIKTTLAIEIMYYVLVFSIKVSIVLFYLRIAVQKPFERSCKITIWVLLVFVVICIIVCLVQCVPLHKMWDFTGMVPGRCINSTAFFYFTSSFNIVTDIWILALPVKTLMSIQRPGREKAALIFVFGLGVFSCIASIVRLHSIRIYTESKDPFYDSVPINLWSMIEVNIGIYCASIPSLKALFFKSQRERTRATTGYKYHSRDKNGAKNSGKIIGGSSSDRSQTEKETFGMNPIVNSLQGPKPAARKEMDFDSERSGSQERIFSPGADTRV
ncbi:hypothetical protein K469DRAFT_570050 [Zopfia rhizophila CBS 207.26]|uniref:Rhodopsin domain-containing protein n=1 Tax=Zopfia rhizophila CBS 207.26 TaxID=1314779 RepID=A0A6A6E622_9PEZI|nr:hypothetical protein K469DRAFT_570050 [Zopfia rhizophila CBS 207.26]